MNKQTTFGNQGQALITLLYFALIGVVVTTAAVVLMITNSLGTTKQQQGIVVYSIAESGAEEGLMQLLRRTSSYIGVGETLTVDGGKAMISVSGSYPGTGANPIKIISVGSLGNFLRKVEVDVIFVSNVLTIQSWKELY